MTLQDDTTLADVKDAIRGILDSGKADSCPACTRRVAREIRPLSWVNCWTLMWLADYSVRNGCVGEFIDMRQFAPKWVVSKDTHQMMTRWGLIESAREPGTSVKNPNAPGAGAYRLTPLGLGFVSNRVRVPLAVVLEIGEHVGMAGDQVTIEEVLADHGRARFRLEDMYSYNDWDVSPLPGLGMTRAEMEVL